MVYVLLVHYPVLNRRGEKVTTSITTLDVHDIARVAKTYGVAGYYIVTPDRATHSLVKDMVLHWSVGHGAEYNADRRCALELVNLAFSIEDARRRIENQHGRMPLLIATSAKEEKGSEKRICFSDMRALISKGEKPLAIIFGTGWGLAEEVFEMADHSLEPVKGLDKSGYNHLSVRSAVSIILDRILGPEI